MTKGEIQKELIERHSAFSRYLTSLSETDFIFAIQNKWTAGQQLDHLCRATAPLTLGIHMPGLITRLLFGRSPNGSMDYGTLVKKYSGVLANGGKSSWMYMPKPVAFRERDKLCQKLLKTVSEINSALNDLTEEELDKKRLPHPLLGKLTIREMMYFTLYHVDHHHTKAKENISLSKFPQPVSKE